MSSDKSSIIDKAQKLAAKGQISQAIAEWQRLIAETPNDGNIYNTIGDLHLKANHRGEATEAYLKAADAFKIAGFELKSIAVYKKIIKVDPSQMEVYEKLADVHAERGLTGNAVEDYLKVAKHYVKQDNFLSALSVYRKLANLDPQNSSVRLKIAEMCQKQGLEKEALEEYEKVLDIYDGKKMVAESRALIEQVLKVNPTYRRKKESVSPESVLIPESSPLTPEPMTSDPTALEPPSVEALQPVADSPVLDEPSVSEPSVDKPVAVTPLSLNERMEGTLAEGNWNDAEKILDELADSPLERFNFLSRWFDYYLERGSFPKAFLILQKAVEVSDGNSYLAESRILIQRYLDENPQQLSAYQVLIENFEKSGHSEEAIECHSKVISLLLERKSEADAKAYYEKVKASSPAIGEETKWRDLFEPAPEIVPQEMVIEKEETSIVNQPIVIQSEPEMVGPSLGAVGTSLEADDQSAEVELSDQISEATFKGHLTEAEVYLKYGLHSKAIEQLLLVSELCPSREEPHVQLKEIYLKQGMTEKAVQECWVLARFYGKRGEQDKKNEILKELAILDPEGQYKQEASGKELPAIAVPDEINSVAGLEQLGSGLEDFEDHGVPESAAQGADQPEIEKDLFGKEELEGLKAKMDRVDEYLDQGNRIAAKSLLWKILERHPNYAEARLKLLKIQETSNADKVEAERGQGTSNVELASEGMDETSFEGLSEALDRSFSGLMSKDDEPFVGSQTERSQTETDEPSFPDQEVKGEEYVDLAAIFSEELEEDSDPVAADLEDTVLDDAFKDFQKGVEASVDEQDFETHYNLGIAYKEMGLLPEAIKEFELAFQGDLRFQDASMMLAACYREKGMTTTAIDFLTNALADPRCKKENLLAMKYELGTIYDSEGDKKRAKALYEEVSQLDPNYRDVVSKNAVYEPEPLMKSVPSAKDEREEGAPQRTPAAKKKNKISYL